MTARGETTTAGGWRGVLAAVLERADEEGVAAALPGHWYKDQPGRQHSPLATGRYAYTNLPEHKSMGRIREAVRLLGWEVEVVDGQGVSVVFRREA